MPYFVYKIEPPLKLTHLATVERYQDAKKQVRELRGDDGMAAEIQYRLVFANTQGEAEKLLSTPRDERVIGED